MHIAPQSMLQQTTCTVHTAKTKCPSNLINDPFGDRFNPIGNAGDYSQWWAPGQCVKSQNKLPFMFNVNMKNEQENPLVEL